MSDMFLIEIYTVRDPRFKEILARLSIEDLRECFNSPSIAKHTEKCCKIYAELRRKRRSLARQEKLSAPLGADQK